MNRNARDGFREAPNRQRPHRRGVSDILCLGERKLERASEPVLGAASLGARRATGGERPKAGEAGNRSHRFLAASSVRVIRDDRITTAGACHDDRRADWALLAAAASEYEMRTISRRAERDAAPRTGEQRYQRLTAPSSMKPETRRPALVSVAREGRLSIDVRAAGILPAR